MTVKRYDAHTNIDDFKADWHEKKDGYMVRYSDYAALLAERDKLAAENAYLLPKAASELSNAWMLHKYWVGIQVALMHVHAGRLHDGMVWLQNTVFGPGIEAPRLSEFAEIEAWANEQQKDSIGHARALEIIKAASPATDAALVNIHAMGVEKFADDCDNDVVFVEPEDTEHYELMAEHAREFADKLRKGGAL